MADEHIEHNFETNVSAQEIDEVISQFRLFNRRLSQRSVILALHFHWSTLTLLRQRQKLFGELPKMTEADLVASGRQGKLMLASVLYH